MTRNKVLPTARQGPDEVALQGNASVVTGGSPSSEVIPVKLKKVPSGRQLRRIESFRLVRPFAEIYYRLSWTTRHTLHVVVNLYVVVYIFLTVPFRLAFYYNPYYTEDDQSVHRWSKELSVFAVMDGFADLIGLFQFLAFYRLWKNTFEKVRSSVRSEKVKKNPTDSTSNSARNLFIRSSSFRKRRGKTKWTIATIESHSSMTDGVAESFLAQRKRFFARSVEFVFEIIAVTPVELIPLALGNFNGLHLVRITKLCRLYRLRRYLARIAKIYADRAWVQHLTSSGVDSLARTISVCAGLCHWVACGYMLIGHAQCGIDLTVCDEVVETSWVVRDRLLGASVARKYGRTLYWASRTLVLLGYDDVTPVSNAETMYALVMTLVGALVGSSLLANFLFLFRFRNARYAAYSTHVDNAREYMRLQNIPREVRHQVTAYYNYAWSTHHSLDSEEALQLMPKHLQSKVVSTLKASRIKQVCFLMKESVEFTNMLALALARRIYSPDDHIIEPKVNAEMFFVIRGKVMISAFDGSKPSECSEGDFFADVCLLSPEQYDQKAVAKTFCEVYVLAKAKFDEAITEFYRGSEADVRSRMAETLEKYSMQLHKMKKLLGLRGAHESGSRKSSMGGSSHSLMAEDVHSHERRRGASWRLPGSSFCMHWNAARLLAIIYVAFEVPYFGVFITMSGEKPIFMAKPEHGLRFMVTLLVEALFGLDLVLRSRFFAYMDPDVMFNVMQPSMIFEAYKKKGFYLDLLAWVPVGLVLDSMSIEPLQGYSTLFRLLRLLRIRWIPSLLQDLSDFYGVSSKLHLVVSLVLGVTLMLHFVGCIWFEMTFLSHDESIASLSSIMSSDFARAECLREATQFQNCSWVKFDCYAHIGTVFPRENPDSTYQASFAYLRSVYWAIVTLTAVGYGDIVAYSTAESYFAALWIFVGGIINFGVVGAMSSTISNMLATHHHHMEKLNTLNTILERMAISEKLSSDIRRFYHHQFTSRKKTYESELLSHLPDRLCYEISSLLHSDSVKSVALFDSASCEFLQEVTGKFRHRSYQNGETICFEGHICREFFVLLQGSKINVFSRSRKVPVRALHGGDSYAVAEFLLRRPYCATLTAASRVHASVMTREQFDVIQRKFSDDINDMKGEAETLCTLELKRLQCIAGNLEKLKLQPHSMQTPSLFYQRDSAIIPNRGRPQTFLSTSGNLRRAFKALWTTLISFWNVYNAAFVIFRICFHAHLHFPSRINTAILIADLSCDVCFAADIYLRLYYFCSSEPGIENLWERKEINKHYFHSAAFKWDLVASMPVYTPFESGSLTASLCRLPRLIRCGALWGYLDDVILQIQQHFATHNVSAYLSPAKLLIILGLVAHYVGCIFFLISEHECVQVESCWMQDDHLLHEYHHSVPILYAKTFYWAITTLLLVGSRESVPRDAVGTIWTGVTCLGCTFIIGHIVGEISELIHELGKETKQYKSRITNFGNFAKVHDLPTSLRERVGFYFHEHFEHTKGIELEKTLDELSANLRLKLRLEIYGRAIANLPICRFLAPSQVNNLALRLRPEYFIPGDNILEEGTFGNRLYTLRKGLAAAYWTKSVSSIAVLLEGSFFGEVAFFLPNQRRLATVRSTTFCEVLFVSKHDWQELWTTTGSASDNQIQKHALHAILGWVTNRLQRYQHACLRIASRAKRRVVPSTKTELVAALMRMTRCHSLPVIETGFFGEHGRKLSRPKAGSGGIDFEIIQRCQRPQYVMQLIWYHRYREWRQSLRPAAVVPQLKRAMGSSLQLPSQRTLLSATTDLESKQFIRRIKEAGKAWDLVMLFVSIYHLIVTPFKLSFSVALVELPLTTLRRWSALEMFMDVFCVAGVVFELRHACMMEQAVISAAANSSRNRLGRIFVTNPELRAYVVAMLPLELLLISDKIRVPFSHSLGLSIDASWWASRWMLRMNRMLLIRRIDHLSEQFLQFVIHDLKFSVSEAVLYFLRGLSSYLATGHILACIWFGISEVGFHYYGTSWLSTSSTFYLASISLARKYLRSLLFSMECISTLFYGDILSMNPLELIAEIAITLWSIYIYGALVGAQAELLDSRARKEAAFEQSLGELQHYVVQNGVPKALKRQIKAYYARLWRRCRGEHEFAAVSGVSRALYEDVILTTLRNFVAQVRSFRALDEHFLRALLVCLRYAVCSENEEVFVVGDVDRSMYFIAHGRILIKTGSSEFARERGDHFGELALLYGISRLETAVALSVSELYRLDHEPYERLLLEFPEHRTRNKLAWTTVDDADLVGSPTSQNAQTALALRPSIAKVAATTPSNVDARLQYSFVYRATMKMLANMQTLHPLEAKDLILKCREAARRHLLRRASNSDCSNGGTVGKAALPTASCFPSSKSVER
ncbi:hypothetical protein PHYSODRAFT_502297 [Phytophthora sojae]|uniref:Cyclic nucleotide-binding domain-containing protein n=1 Tax=Phytophthora sojae (strain P6497) TaxID=1094619 RepID=G4ZF25_PHYSP|nr:hypothetical protein PHYSODRAFT_502297 [Phytophthora sojae]EGZ18456.1 hypothetical protein PHYSODRAFT_502297 [Phytophthora sojae]|eukprot:XP_009527514.1 hypothetical protein PHYSODRAFT_502297 [Phytophthora sojae]